MAVRSTFPQDRVIAIEFIEPCDEGPVMFKQAHEVINLHLEQQGGPLVAIWDVEHAPVRFDSMHDDPLILLSVPE